jgi:hypothetical protein
MIRALTIRFAVMCLGAVALTFVLDLTKPAPGLVAASVIAYVFAGSVIIALYCLAHEDEIPVRSTGRHTHRS